MLAGMILGAAAVVAVLMFLQMGRFSQEGNRHFVWSSLVGLSIAGSVVAVVIVDKSNRDSTDERRLAGVAVTELARVSSGLEGSGSPTVTAGSVSAPASKVASVPSLISGLEQRLAQDPDDARGWGLLAQSYAFIGNADEAEQALSRAVGLGADESDLRQRVAGARRDPHAGIPGAPPLD